jgi:hypothetical protein
MAIHLNAQFAAAWDEMERFPRLVYGYEGCIFGPDQRCPEDALARCDFCATSHKLESNIAPVFG